MPLLYGRGYDNIVPLTIVIAPNILFIGVSNVLGKQYLLPTQQQRAYTISILCGSGTNVVFNFLLIPFLGSIGAAFGTVIAEFSVMAVQIYFVRKSLPLKDYFLCGVRYLLLGAGMCLIVLLTGMVVPSSIPGTLVQVGCGMVIYLGALLVLRDEMMLTGIRMVTAKFRRRK